MAIERNSELRKEGSQNQNKIIGKEKI